jgi:glyoxylase I family protein
VVRFLVITKVRGLHHIKLTVSDLGQSRAFYEDLPGFKLVAEYPDFVMFTAGDVNIGLTSHDERRMSERFNELTVGLDHLAFRIDDESELEAAITYLETRRIPHGEIKTLSNGVKIVTFRDPDNIQLEFAWKPKHT